MVSAKKVLNHQVCDGQAFSSAGRSRKMQRNLFATLSVVLALAGCGGDKPGQPKGGPGGMPSAEVDIVVATPGVVTTSEELPGRLQATRTAQVRARVEGVVDKRLFTEGSDIAAGKSLFLIDPRVYQAAADSAEADVAVAKVTVERYRPLIVAKAISQQEFDQAQAKLKQAESTLARAKLDLENASVPAPISGRIGRAAVTEGALVGKGEATLLATIEQLDPIYANFTQSNADALRLQQAVKAGRARRADETRVELVLEDGSVYPLPGALKFTDLAVDPNTGAIELRAQFPNPKRELLPGTFVRVRLSQALLENAIKLPQRAVQSSSLGQFVMVVDKDGKVAPQPVKADGMSGDEWVIAEGLKGGEQVIVNGLQKAPPGSTVKPVLWNRNAAAAPAAAAEKK
jgi:membrane fusion protein, multidrug efflux system